MDWLIYHEEPITLSSGGRSHWFVDAAKIFENERLREQVLSCWARSLPDFVREWHFIGVPEGGMCWSQAMATKMGKRLGTTATWGNPRQRVPDGASIAVVEDVVTTGRSLFSVVNKYTTAKTLAVVVRNPGVSVACAWNIIDLRESADVLARA